MHGSHGDLFLALCISKLSFHFFFYVWNHNVYQSAQVTVKFVMPSMIPNNVSNCLIFSSVFLTISLRYHILAF